MNHGDRVGFEGVEMEETDGSHVDHGADSRSGGNDGSRGPDTIDKNADRRDARSRAQRLKKLLELLDVQGPVAEEIVADLQSLLPPQHRMSSDEDVVERLKSLLLRDSKSPLGTALSHSGAKLDIASDSTVRSQDRLDDILAEGDERLLQAYVANERLRGVLATQVGEHEAMRKALIAELARRYTVLEQWRYKLPKYLMPVIAVLLKAKVKRDDLRLGKTLLSDIIDLVVAHSKQREVSRESLVEAARLAEAQFDSLINEGAQTDDCNGTKEVSPEPFEAAESRLKPFHDNLRTAWHRSKDEHTEAKLRPYSWLSQAGAGLDAFGRPVFRDAEDFEAAIRYLVEQNRAEFSS
ncbi:hypothetical protein [Qipengyuania flava]|uniref:hypothetical protein n=1 Tax=Qipengyuania flava TaxID=192812 RepID=UPI003BB0AE8E